MSRSWAEGDCDDTLLYGRWRAQVASAIRGKRGQGFLRELAAAMDAMPEKYLIKGDLVTEEGDCCALGVVCKARGLDVSDVDPEEHEVVGETLDIAHQLASEIAYENDDDWEKETDEQRWTRMRAWVARLIREERAESGGETR